MRPSIAWIILNLCACIYSAAVTQTYNDGQYHPSSSYYTSIYVATTTYSMSVARITQANAVVTVTSYIPCPVTTTVYIYQCNAACPTTTAYVPTTTAYIPATTAVLTTATAVGQFGTTTVTRYTTQSVAASYQYQTVTSGSYVLVIANPTTAAAQANVNGAGSIKSASHLVLWEVICGLLVLWVGVV